MRFLTILLVYSSFYLVSSTKSNVRALTESMGQEVIEIDGHIKDLPPDIDEEPSVDSAEALTFTKGSTIPPPPPPPTTTTKRNGKKSTVNLIKTMSVDTSQRGKDIDKIDKLSLEEAVEEERIEKEFSDLYKDNNADYKMDSSETVKDKGNVTKKSTIKDSLTTLTTQLANISSDEPILRERPNFNFQPESFYKKDVERFRTSIDEITCERSVTKLAQVVSSRSAQRFAKNFIILVPVVYVTICM